MVAIGRCVMCRPVLPPEVSNLQTWPHCYGTGDQPAPPGVMGGFWCNCECRDWERPTTLLFDGSPGDGTMES